MAKKTVHAPGGPKKVFGMENTAYAGPQTASDGKINGDVRSAISDFVQEEDHGQVDPSDAGDETPIGDIDSSGEHANDLEQTVIAQSDRIASLESTLFQVEILVERAMRKGYSPDAYELAEILDLEEDE